MEQFAEIIIENRHYKTDRPYTYMIPAELSALVVEGAQVVVPFGYGNKKIRGYVLRKIEHTSFEKNLKSILSVIGDEPILTPAQLRLACWMREYYVCFYIDAIHTVLPSAVRSEVGERVRLRKDADMSGCTPAMLRLAEYIEEQGGELGIDECRAFDKNGRSLVTQLRKAEIVSVVSLTKSDRYVQYERYYYLVLDSSQWKVSKRAVKQIQVLNTVKECPGISASMLRELGMGDREVLKTLTERGYLRVEEKEAYRKVVYTKIEETKHKLNEEQEQAMQRIEEGFAACKPVLLHGITGSGKTEIYLELIEKKIEAGKDSIVLVPEISLTPQIIGRFKSRFGDKVAVLHSGLSEGEKADEWRRIKRGLVDVVIGARSAIFAPLPALGLVIIDEEHEHTYKSENTPKYLTAEVAHKRCLIESADLLLGSATPSLESYYACAEGRYGLAEILHRANGKPLPRIQVVDMRNELKEGNKKMFSRLLRQEIIHTLEQGNQIILFMNRRGYSTFISCRECGYVLRCPSCDISLTYHRRENRLHCHYCGYNQPAPNICPQCGSRHIRYFGIGTQKIEEAFTQEFSTTEVLRMDADTTRKKNSHMDILEKFRRQEAKVLIGTQMIAKGHDFPNVTLVGVLAADMGIYFPDYRSAEKNFQIIEQVAGRSGRAEKMGKVIVQSYNPDHYSIRYAKMHDYQGFYDEEIAIRKSMDYPPFTTILNCIMSGTEKQEVIQGAKQLKEQLEGTFPEGGYELLGPTAAPIDRIKNRYRWQMLVKSSDEDLLRNMMRKVLYHEIVLNDCVNITTDLKPVNLL